MTHNSHLTIIKNNVEALLEVESGEMVRAHNIVLGKHAFLH